MNLIFCLVSLLGAFLLFQVQPVISKFILPWFGGSPGVWTTCMLFFQVLLFGGYSYAHFLASRKPRTQMVVHGLLLLAAVLCLPIEPNAALQPAGNEEPIGRILLLLLRTVGLPYLVLSATSPLLQVWFTHQFPSRSPWRLYSLSNIGSLTALLSYPVLIETRWSDVEQTRIWSWTFVVFALCMGFCAWANRVHPEVITPEGDPHPQAATHATAPTWGRRLLWLLLPAFASVMLLATTNHLCQDVAVIPFLWILPLSLYLLSFIICFDHPRWYWRSAWAIATMVLLFGTSAIYNVDAITVGFSTEIVVLVGAMFGICMVCHGELARLKPDTRHLTSYYLHMSAGGAVGGLAVSLVAPLIFTTFFEWPLSLLVGFLFVAWVGMRALQLRAVARIVWAVVSLVLVGFIARWELEYDVCLTSHRDFYGLLSVAEKEDPDTHEQVRSFISGTIRHGRQDMRPDHRRDQLSYYAPQAGSGIALLHVKDKPDARVGVVGMGAGCVAGYGEKGQTYRFYELNPAAEKLALKWFTFVSDFQARGGKYEISLGDARLSLKHEAPQNFDVLMLDAFSGDSVPMHLLTIEAFNLYLTHLKPDGVIVANVTNRAVNLAPVLGRIADELGMQHVRISYTPPENVYGYATDFVLISRDAAFIRAQTPSLPSWAVPIEHPPLWTDHHHNLFDILITRKY
ncbi:MAG: fused MFS/spermidine synthase [Verrucomicrobia bacterium]|nr:fused MFS/spermidine synthase [Verrucomicrobiota bacterium]